MHKPWKLITTVVIFLVLLEAYLWIGSFLTQFEQNFSNSFQANKKGVYRIMCIGESLTLVGGKDSYPSQLEDILNQTAKDGRQYQVLNQGRPGATSTVITEHLPFWLDKYKPDMVIVMMGIIDNATFKEEGAYQNRSLMAFVKGIKLVQMYQRMSEKASAGLKDFIVREKWLPVKKEKPYIGELEMFKDEMQKQSPEQNKLYILIILAEAYKRYDIADILYQRFLQNNTNGLISHWMYKKYGDDLVALGAYDKFVQLMEHIDYDSWKFAWIRGYCNSQEHMDLVAGKIDKMVINGTTSPLAYGYAESCYEQGGRKDLAAVYARKMEFNTSPYLYAQTRKNYEDVKEMLISRGVQPVFVQYPNRDVSWLLDIFKGDPDIGKIIFVDNGPSFHEAIRQRSYEYYFIDRMSGDVGHAKREGNQLLASNVARAVLLKLSQ